MHTKLTTSRPRPTKLVAAAASDQDIRLEPTLVQVAAEQPAHFTCSLAGAHARVDWRRNGRKLLVKWLEEHEEPADARSRLVARRSGDNQYQLTIMRVHAKDDNATFTCQPATDQADQADELARESNPARLRVLLPAEDDAQESPATPQDSQRNSSAPLAEFGPRHRLSLHETLGDLFELSKPSLVLVGLLLCSVGLALVLVQLLKLRRRSTRRYVKHASIGQLYTPAGTSSSSCASAGLPASGSFESADCKPDTGGQSNLLRDPMLSSLMSRTLLGSGQPLAKQRSYRDNWRKVAAAELSGAPDQTHLYRGPNLYNQSLAAREQARSLLQASEHMRSLGNLSAAASQHNKHQLAGARATSALTKAFELHQQLAGGSANGSHLNLPLSFNLADGASMWRQNEHDEDEHYQLVKCDPSSSDSSVSGNSLATKTRHGQRGPSSNHYSVIEPSAHDELDWQQLAGASTGCLGSRQPSIRQQLSPYAVSSICNAIPPPVNSEAMRALTEQFDINQLMLLDQGQQQQNQHQHQQEARTAALQFFESAPCPPPPPPPPPPCPPVRQVRGSPANQ